LIRLLAVQKRLILRGQRVFLLIWVTFYIIEKRVAKFTTHF